MGTVTGSAAATPPKKYYRKVPKGSSVAGSTILRAAFACSHVKNTYMVHGVDVHVAAEQHLHQ